MARPLTTPYQRGGRDRRDDGVRARSPTLNILGECSFSARPTVLGVPASNSNEAAEPDLRHPCETRFLAGRRFP